MKINQQSFRLTCLSVLASSLLLLSSGCHKATVRLVAGNPSGSLNSPTTLAIAFPILNDGKGNAENVQATSISIAGVALTNPATLPANLGTVPEDGLTTLAAAFSGTFQE